MAVALLSVTASADPDPRPERRRFEWMDEAGEGEVTPGDGETVQTFTPTLARNPDEGALLLFDANGVQRTGSNLVAAPGYTVPEGTLDAGGQYEWHVVAPVGIKRVKPKPIFSDDGFPDGPVDLATYVESEVIQSPQAFVVGSKVGAKQASHGLYARFWSLLDLDEDEKQGMDDDFLPAPGARIPNLDVEVWLRDVLGESCPTVQGGGIDPNDWSHYVPCSQEYNIEYVVPDITGGRPEDDVAFNIEGRNVAHNYATTLNADLAQSGGFEFTTADREVLSYGFGLRNRFAFRALGTLRVPETGVYTFSTRSAGGARVYVYQRTEQDLGKTLVSQPNAWAHPKPGNDCNVFSSKLEFSNPVKEDWKQVGPGISQRKFEYDKDDESWWQPDEDLLHDLQDELASGCGLDSALRAGTPIELVAGEAYPIMVDAWVGQTPGRVEVHVTDPHGMTMPLPFEWLEAASPGLVTHDRVAYPLAQSGASQAGQAFTLGGDGRAMTVLDSDSGLTVYESDGLGGWSNPNSLTRNGAPIGATAIPYQFRIDRDGSSIQNGRRMNHAGPNLRLWIGPESARFEGPIEMSFRVKTGEKPAPSSQWPADRCDYDSWGGFIVMCYWFTYDSGTTVIDTLEFDVDYVDSSTGRITNGKVSGSTTSSNQADADINRVDQGTVDRSSGRISITLSGTNNSGKTELVLDTNLGESQYGGDPSAAEFSEGFTPKATGGLRASLDEVRIESRENHVVLMAPFELDQRRRVPEYCHDEHSCLPAYDEWRQVQLDTLTLRYSSEGPLPERPIASANFSGTYRSNFTNKPQKSLPLTDISGTVNVVSGLIDIRVTAEGGHTVDLQLAPSEMKARAYHDDAVAMDYLGNTLVVAPDRDGSGAADVLIFSKFDECEPFADANVDMTSVGMLLDEAGIPRPYSSLPVFTSALPVPGTGGARQNLDADNPDHNGALLTNGVATLYWEGGNLVLRDAAMTTLWETGTKGTRLSFQGDGNLVVRENNVALWASGTHGNRGHSLRIMGTRLVVLSEAGKLEWQSPNAVKLPDLPLVPQGVKITPDGRTIAIQQPTLEGLRLDVLDREGPGQPWEITGSFAMGQSGGIHAPYEVATLMVESAFAVGAEEPPVTFRRWCWEEDPHPYTQRYVAFPSPIDPDVITVMTQAGSGEAWEEIAELRGHTDVTSLAFDYSADNLAIGEPTRHRVSVYTRPYWWDPTHWAHTKELSPQGKPGFGAKVTYTFGVLGITTDGSYKCGGPGGAWPLECDDSGPFETYNPGEARYYRDVSGWWTDYTDWTDLELAGLNADRSGPHVLLSVAGDTNTQFIGVGEVRNGAKPWDEVGGKFRAVDNYRP